MSGKAGWALAYAHIVATTEGLEPADFNGHSFRIGGAPDAADGGETAGQLQSRGRWLGEDIGWIYARDTVGQQIKTADAIAAANSCSVEGLFAGWVEPSR